VGGRGSGSDIEQEADFSIKNFGPTQRQIFSEKCL
jgi:hypothetical protein